MNFERIKKRGPVSKEYVGQKSAGKGLSRVLFSDQLRIYTFSQSKIYRLFTEIFLEDEDLRSFSY